MIGKLWTLIKANPVTSSQVVLLAAVLILSTGVGAYWMGRADGKDLQGAKQQSVALKQSQTVSKNRERIENETQSMSDIAIDNDLRDLGIMRRDDDY